MKAWARKLGFSLRLLQSGEKSLHFAVLHCAIPGRLKNRSCVTIPLGLVRVGADYEQALVDFKEVVNDVAFALSWLSAKPPMSTRHARIRKP